MTKSRALTFACLLGAVAALLNSPGCQGAYESEKVSRHVRYAKQAHFDHVSFVYDSSLAAAVTGGYVPAETSGFGPHPPYVSFFFGRYVVARTRQSALAARLYVVPLAGSYLSTSVMRARVNYEKGLLQAKLRDRPRLSPSAQMPFLPEVGAAQLLVARAHYFPFRNGSGLSYLTDFAQNSVVITNDMLEYVYQGITKDGRFYVSLVLPLSTRVFSNPPWTYPDPYAPYLARVAQKLGAASPGAFTPNLASLDALAASILANPTFSGRATMYVSGAPTYTGANLRSQPDIQSAVLAFIPNGAAVQASLSPLRGADGRPWYRVSYRGKTGYVLGSLLSPYRS